MGINLHRYGSCLSTASQLAIQRFKNKNRIETVTLNSRIQMGYEKHWPYSNKFQRSYT